MPNYTVTSNIDTLLKSTTNAAARTNLGLGDAATKNTGSTAGTVAAGDDSRIAGALQTSGGTMTGKLTAAADNTIAKLSVGARTTGSSPTALADGDIWISNQGALSYRDSTGPTSRAVAATSLSNTFNQPQTIGSTANAGAVLSVSNSGTREVVTISNTATATSDAVVITNLGSGNSLVVNDETTPDSTRFAVANNGRVGIGVAPDAVAALAVDSTGIKFSDGTTQTTAASGGSGTVTSITAGTGLTGGTITASGTVAADFGTTAGKVTEGGTTVLKTGDTMTGKLALPAAAANAPLNITPSGLQPTTVLSGDIWIRNNLIQYRGSSATVNSVAATAEPNVFTTNQTISPTGSTTSTALAVTQNASNPNGALTVDLNNTSSTATAVRITNQGTGASLVVEDQSVDPTPFTISNSGKVGIGVAPDAAVALSVDASGIKFSDGTVQITAGGAGGVSSFSAGTTGLTPATSTTGAVTLAGTLAIANGGTGQTTAANAINALVPAQSGQSGKVLTTDGSVVSWGTAGGSGITALTGDVSASGSGSVSASVTGLRGRVVATTAPTTGQVLGWNGTTNQWEPTSAGGAVAYDVLRVLITGPASGTYNVPSGYKYADIYAAGAGGGGGSGQYVNGATTGYGGGGGAHGVFGRRQKLGVENASINYELSAGGLGGVPDGTGIGVNGASGTGTLVYFSSLPTSGSSSSVILDCGYYINAGGQSGTWGYSGQSGGVGGQLSLFSTWPQNVQNGGTGGSGSVGGQPQTLSYFLETFNISAGAGGGGVDPGNSYNGGNILDLNYMLYTSNVPQVFNGIAGSSTTIDATAVLLTSGQNIFWGGAGGAGADAASAVYTGSFYRAGNGADGGFGCGGGGGGAMYDPSNVPSSFRPGSGGNGGAGFLLMYLYK